MAGYSGKPLAGKLGIKAGCKLYLRNAPADYDLLLAPLPENVTPLKRLAKELDIAQVFVARLSELVAALDTLPAYIKPAGMIWVCWPKKASGVVTDVTEDRIRDVALPLGLVDVKVCAIDETWSGLKLVIRKENRK